MTSSNLERTSSLQAGPAGRAMAEAMDPEILDAMQQHLNMERKAHAAYFAAAIWFAEREFRGFARLFRQESADEHQHAAKISDYLIARGQTVQLNALDAPNQDWGSPEEAMATSFLMECDVTTSLQQLHSMAERVGDTRTTVFLEPMVDQQIQSEHTFAHLLGRVRLARGEASAMLIIDNELDHGHHKPASLQDGND